MGHKIHPRAMRLGYVQDWQSRWFAPRNMPAFIREDFDIRALIKDRFRMAAVSWIGIERAGSYLRINIHTARPGVIIGKKGADIEALRKTVEGLTTSKVFINVIEVKDPELDARLVAESVAMQLEKRAHYASALRRSMERAMAAKALGIKIMVSGRIGGAEIARTEWKREGRVPLHTLCADIDYGTAEASTMSGKIGIKVWIFKKLHFAKSPREIIAEMRKSGDFDTPPEAVAAPLVAAKAEKSKKEPNSNVDAEKSKVQEAA